MQFAPRFSAQKLLVHVHVADPGLFPALKACLENFQGLKYDLTVTLDGGSAHLEKDIMELKDDAEIIRNEGKAGAGATFVDALRYRDLAKYDLAVKLCGMSRSPADGSSDASGVTEERAHHMMLSPVSSRAHLIRTLRIFATDPTLGMAGHHALIMPERDAETQDATAAFMRAKLGVEPEPSHECLYLAGGVFVARVKLLEPLLRADADLISESVLERAMGWLVTSGTNEQGKHYRIYDPLVPGFVTAWQLHRKRAALRKNPRS